MDIHLATKQIARNPDRYKLENHEKKAKHILNKFEHSFCESREKHKQSFKLQQCKFYNLS
jgi:hypothetical protein